MKTKTIIKGFALLSIFALTGCASKEVEKVDYDFKIDVHEKYQIMEVEYGSKASLEDNYFIYASGQFELEIPEIDTKKMGETDYTVKRSDGDVTVKVTVKDTKTPEFQGDDKFTILEGAKFDIKSWVKAVDPVDGEVEVKFDKTDFSKPGEYTVNASAEDVNGNKSTKKITVIVKEIPEVRVPQSNNNTPQKGNQSNPSNSKPSNSKPSNSGSKPSNSGSSNSGSSNSGSNNSANDDLVKVNIKLDGGTIHSYAVYSSDMVGIYITKNDGSGISYLWRSGQLSYSQNSSPLSGADHARIQELVRSWIN